MNSKMAELMCMMKVAKVAMDDLVERVDTLVRENRMFTTNDLPVKFPRASRSSMYSIVSENRGYTQLCAHWIPKKLTDDHN